MEGEITSESLKNFKPVPLVERPQKGKKEEKPPEDIAQFKFEIPEIKLSEVIGMQKAKLFLHKNLGLPITHSKQFEDFGMTKSCGIILYGPPGTGKTLISKAIANELKLKICCVGISDVLSKYVGESEKKVARLFYEAKKNQPCIIFFDEADVLLQSRDNVSSEGAGTELRGVINEMLKQTSDIHEDKKTTILMIAATNHVWDIDPAHKRPGRFDYLLYIGAPDFWERQKLFRLYTKADKAKEEWQKDPNNMELFRKMRLYGKIDYGMLSLATIDYAPVDIEQVTKAAKLNTMEHKKVTLTTHKLQKVLQSRDAGKSSLDAWYLTMYHKYLPEKKSWLKMLFSKAERKREPEKRKFDSADIQLYKDLVKDVNRHMRWHFFTRLMRLYGRGW